ncbi:hypothetical protein [Micromonospora sp. WMMD975]|uniref:hypothetical protein n=1 Tax=Micromonospora sp. WMMD975 TaxID=3016087 RepID=UPI00249AC040|nr:hypothetical protein [Micromonospora sp. WMMD975]WFE31706.1 hypothetical protein O7613_19095 [Micromonospora sp. WMMD975]
MGKHRRLSDDAPPSAAEDSGATYWSVAEGGWPSGAPELADLLAPPIVVGVARVAATSRVHPAAVGATTVRLHAGSRATVPARRSPAVGRHRNVTA